MRDSKGRLTGAMLPQTPEGWIDKYIRESENKVIKLVGLKPIIDKRASQKRTLECKQDPIKREHKNKLNRESHTRHRESHNKRVNDNYHKDPLKYSIKAKKYFAEHHDEIVADQTDYYWNRGGRAVAKEYNKLHPKSGGGSDSLEEVIAMNLARKRDNNACRWGGCNAKADEVNHIFGRATHPHLSASGWNLISYCFDHHIQWHEYKGEYGAVALIKSNRDRKMPSCIIGS